MSSIPFLGYWFRRLHVWWHNKTHRPCHMPANIPHGKVGEGQCQEHVLPVEEWDPISMDDVQERFGIAVIEDLLGNPQLLRIMYAPPEGDFTWFVNQNGALMVHFHNRKFLYYGKDASYDAWVELHDETVNRSD